MHPTIPGMRSKRSHAANARSLTNNFFNNMVCQFPRLLGFVRRMPPGDWAEFMEGQVDECNDILSRAYGVAEAADEEGGRAVRVRDVPLPPDPPVG